MSFDRGDFTSIWTLSGISPAVACGLFVVFPVTTSFSPASYTALFVLITNGVSRTKSSSGLGDTLKKRSVSSRSENTFISYVPKLLDASDLSLPACDAKLSDDGIDQLQENAWLLITTPCLSVSPFGFVTVIESVFCGNLSETLPVSCAFSPRP